MPRCPELPQGKGLTGAHLLESLPMAGAPQTTEQKIRGGDATADWVMLVGGYDLEAVKHASSQVAGGIVGIYRPVYSLSAGEIA